MGVERLLKVFPFTESPFGEEGLEPSATSVAEQCAFDFKEVARHVREHLEKAQNADKEAFDQRVHKKKTTLMACDRIYTAAHAKTAF